MRVRQPLIRTAPVALLASLALISLPGTSVATEAPRAAQDPVVQRQSSLAERIAAAEHELRKAQTKLATTYEKATAAQNRHQHAAEEADAARSKAEQAREEAKAVSDRAEELRRKVDEFAAASYRRGSTLGSIGTYLGSDSPVDMLSRATLINAISDKQSDALDAAKRAVEEKSAAEEAAQRSLQEAMKHEAEATAAKAEAERAYQKAIEEKEAAQEKADELIDRKTSLAQQESQASSSDQDAESAASSPADSSAEPQSEASAPAKPEQQAVSGSGSASVVKPADGRLTSTYGPRWGTIHYGIDIANSIGTPIYSAMAGTVISSGPARGFGLWVRVQHDNGLITVYGHINESLVSIGQRVEAGQQIATIGNRGQSTGPHLHFEVHDGGQRIDPLVWLRSQGISI